MFRRAFRRLEAEVNRKLEGLECFLMQVTEFMQEWGDTFPDETSCISYLDSHLEGPTAKWFVTTYHTTGPEVQSVHTFVRALREQYEGPLEMQRAQNVLHTLKQGSKLVKIYSAEFREHAAQIPEWP